MNKDDYSKIVILESNDKDARELKNVIETDEKLKVEKIFANAEEVPDYVALNKIDLVVMELILQNGDGFELIKKLKSLNSNVKVLVLSALSGEGFVQKAFSEGADYYIIKPYKPEYLIERIKNLIDFNFVFNQEENVSKPKNNNELTKYKQLDGKITNIFITVGIPAHIKGYQFLREAIKMAIENPEIINSITKKLYPSIAERFETSASKVERAIRHAIEVAWNRGKIENINTLFGVKVYSNNEKPTNGEFIALVADKMLIEGA